MTVDPRSIAAAYHEYSRSSGGLPCLLPQAAVAEIIEAVHSVARKHQRSREIQMRIRKALRDRKPLALPASAIEGGTEP
ncbi:hypothetical protein ASF34_00935 [Methylobacterium sp. Leaf106]|nr:hypothetical protein ASF34_00935 [Methylobacterium sp. Leaf106]